MHKFFGSVPIACRSSLFHGTCTVNGCKLSRSPFQCHYALESYLIIPVRMWLWCPLTNHRWRSVGGEMREREGWTVRLANVAGSRRLTARKSDLVRWKKRHPVRATMSCDMRSKRRCNSSFHNSVGIRRRTANGLFAEIPIPEAYLRTAMARTITITKVLQK